MKPAYRTDGNAAIVYDADRLDQAPTEIFDLSYWEARAALVGQAAGRGTTWFVQQGEEQWALRHYKRGGFMAQLATDHYFWLGLARSRAWREWHLVADLHQRGLPVPTPVAARVIRDGMTYRADIITVRLAGVYSLSHQLRQASLAESGWRRLGSVLRRFHATGLHHTDLTSDNILMNAAGDFWLIDFDNARLRKPGGWQGANLQRLLRSLRKRQGLYPQFLWNDSDWAALLAGYAGG